MARGRPDKSLARFERIALVLSGGGALGAYQAGAYSALEKSGVRSRVLALPHYFLLANVAALIAGYQFVRGERYSRWEPIREGSITKSMKPAR